MDEKQERQWRQKAIRMMLSEEGLNFSNRKITISTAGILPGIVKLGQEDFTINLAISLNAPTDELRSQLMPINDRYPLQRLLQACREYPLPERRHDLSCWCSCDRLTKRRPSAHATAERQARLVH